MPLFTPSRVLAFFLSFALVSFLWRIGLPRQYSASSLPVVQPDPSRTIPLPLPDAVNPAVGAENGRDGGAQTTLGEGQTTAHEDGNTGSKTNCKDVRGARDTMVIVKTSRAEMKDKLPPHLQSLLSCVPHAALFSDHSGTISGIPIYNALEPISNTTKAKHDEFLAYESMQADNGFTPTVDQLAALEKWKFLPMVYKVATMHPHYKFYLFVDVDTAVSWSSLLQWLARFDFRIQYYIGAPATTHEDMRFAKQGSGILLSYGAMRHFVKSYEERYESEWEARVASSCCGDQALGEAMRASRVEFYAVEGMVGEEREGVEWSQRGWCVPVVTWRGLGEEESGAFYKEQEKWTAKWGWEKPVLHRDVFREAVMPLLEEEKAEWDNGSKDSVIKGEPKDEENHDIPAPSRGKRDADTVSTTLQHAVLSPANCRNLCKQTEDCVQWKHSSAERGACHLSRRIRLGKQSKNAGGEKGQWTSGWIMERVKKATEEWGGCEKVEWGYKL